MKSDNLNNDPKLQRNFYSTINIDGTSFVEYRDIPQLIRKHVLCNNLDPITLDYGCGTGKSALFLKSIGIKSTKSVHVPTHGKAEANDPSGEYTIIKSGEVPMSDEYFDFILSVHSFESISEKAELLNVFREIARVLKPNGVFIVMTWNEYTFVNEWISYGAFTEPINLKSGLKYKIQFKENNLSEKKVYWSSEDLLGVFGRSDLSVIEIYQPFGRPNDGYEWINETEIPPVTIYVAKRISCI